jgi:dynein heavy chain
LFLLKTRAKEWAEAGRKREEFRRALVKLIHGMTPAKKEDNQIEEILRQTGDTFDTDNGKPLKLNANFEPTPEDLGELRYRFYIQHGLDAVNIGPIGETWLENIWKNVSAKLQFMYSGIAKELEKEVTDDYRIAVKRSMVDFVLHEPDKHTVAELDSGPRSDDILKRVPKPWRGSFILAKKKLLRNLHSYNPVLGYINFIWKAVFWYEIFNKIICKF